MTTPSSSSGPSGPRLGKVAGGLLLLGLALASALVLLASLGLVDPSTWTILGVSADELVPLTPSTRPATRFAAGLVSLLVGLVSLLIFVRGLRPAERPSERHVLSADDRGMVLVETRGIATVAETAVKRVYGVNNAKVQVVGQGASPIRLLLTLWVSAAAELKQVGDQARHKAQEAVESLVGIEVHEVVVRLEVVPLEELGRVLQ